MYISCVFGLRLSVLSNKIKLFIYKKKEIKITKRYMLWFDNTQKIKSCLP
jgi:hypothetical protein